jgi:ABC-type multidrug transport system ATPase subunit
MINGLPLPVGTYDEQMRTQGYVRQSDTLFETLNVWETLAYAAALRLPDSLELSDKLARAMLVMQNMGLLGVARSVVGSPLIKGISGGQRRRLSIALELLRLPSVLMLDEPTSGLDSMTSLQLVQRLHDMAKDKEQPRTVVATIHQPRAEAFELFDQILLLSPAGRMVYFGPVRRPYSISRNNIYYCTASGRGVVL